MHETRNIIKIRSSLNNLRLHLFLVSGKSQKSYFCIRNLNNAIFPSEAGAQQHSRLFKCLLFNCISYWKSNGVELHCCSVSQQCPALCDPVDCSTPVPCPSLFPGACSLISIDLVIPSNHLILCRALLLLPSFFPSIRVFSSESTLCIMWPKYWSFSFSISPSNKYSGFISFRIDWFDLLVAQGTPRSPLQHRNPKALVIWWSAFFTTQLSQPT